MYAIGGLIISTFMIVPPPLPPPYKTASGEERIASDKTSLTTRVAGYIMSYIFSLAVQVHLCSPVESLTSSHGFLQIFPPSPSPCNSLLLFNAF